MTNPFKKPLLETECTAFEERAAIVQFDGNVSREAAEHIARISTRDSERAWTAYYELRAFRRAQNFHSITINT